MADSHAEALDVHLSAVPQVGHALGFFALGASLHYILNRIKSEPSTYPRIQVYYSPTEPLFTPITINLPANGIRLNFDAMDQRLRFVEVLDFGKTRIAYQSQDIVRFDGAGGFGGRGVSPGPTFKHAYKLFGGTTPGEFVGEDGGNGKYCLSYPGIAFWFPMQAPEGFSKLDWASTVSVLSSSACAPAASMVLYHGMSWHTARKHIYTAEMPFPRTPVPTGRKDGIPVEIELAKVHDRGRVELVRKGDVSSFWITLSETTQQDLVTELGPPDSTYKKSVKHTSAHQGRRASSTTSSRRPSDATNSDRRSASSHTEDSDNSAWEDEDDDDEETTTVANEFDKDDRGIWWNYYSHGLDILITQPTSISSRSPTLPRHLDGEEGYSSSDSETGQPIARNVLTATKIILHSNVPGSYQFNRHRRLRWTLEDWPSASGDYTDPLTSEMKFIHIQARLKDVFKNYYENDEEERGQQEPMAINRDWGEGSSLGGSVELLGGWEESGRKGADGTASAGEEEKIGEVLMFGFPGLGFEVCKNGVVGALQVW